MCVCVSIEGPQILTATNNDNAGQICAPKVMSIVDILTNKSNTRSSTISNTHTNGNGYSIGVWVSVSIGGDNNNHNHNHDNQLSRASGQ